MTKDISLNLDLLSRVEGHGRIVADIADGILQRAEFQIVEAPRFFEAIMKGRSIFEAPHIASRICGICACAHSLASIRAVEDAIGLAPGKQTLELRRLLLCMELLDSHLLHINFLILPDLFGVESIFKLAGRHDAVIQRAFRLKKACNDICEILVGRHVHPISCVVGGFTKLPGPDALKTMHRLLQGVRADLEKMTTLLAGFEFPDFIRETEFVALVSDNDPYPLLSGDIGSSDGVRRPAAQYRSVTNEFLVAHSAAKHTRLSRDCYAVGALARLHLNRAGLHSAAKSAAEKLGLSVPCHNPFLNTPAQLVESVHCAEEGLLLLENFLAEGVDRGEVVLGGDNETKRIPVKAGQGVGAIEAPRGLLVHDYLIDEKGLILQANCVIPTGQNLGNIEADMRKLVAEVIDRGEAEMTRRLEMLVRAYDPCISCSVH